MNIAAAQPSTQLAAIDVRSLGHLLRVALDRAEPAIEWIIRLCGWSAILFVFSIFFFVFRDAAPVLFGKLNLDRVLHQHRAGSPSPRSSREYGTLALLVGTLSVTALAMALAVPLGLGAAVFISEFCGGKLKETLKILDRVAGGHSFDRLGIRRLHGARPR